MASWSEIERVRKNADEARRIARSLLASDEIVPLRPWEIEFLTGIQSRTFLDELYTRQAEKVLEIRDAVELVSRTGDGLSVSSLVHRCYEARLDLDEDDEEWIKAVYTFSRSSIRRRDLRQLLRCAYQLGVIDSLPA